jgi:hypothetical protein
MYLFLIPSHRSPHCQSLLNTRQVFHDKHHITKGIAIYRVLHYVPIFRLNELNSPPSPFTVTILLYVDSANVPENMLFCTVTCKSIWKLQPSLFVPCPCQVPLLKEDAALALFTSNISIDILKVVQLSVH